ncbi:MAG: peptidoglycan-binding protein [Candidatus Peribacteraceae bacterium]|nr:peptidoglycan-binding protein [Candidatus Peribacteraceae bacterium]
MHIHRTPLHRPCRAPVPLHIRVLLVLISVFAPVMAVGVSKNAAHEQEFIITAYYSPVPGQCCYVMGGLQADKVLNGNGVRGADGTEVHPGMIAAPASYAFGTVVVLPGVGRFTVHDRGGAIQELDSGAHRLDIWVGYGEEGLARALAFGVQHIRGTVYPVGGNQPKEKFVMENLPAVIARLRPFQVAGNSLLSVTPRSGEQGLSVELLQRSLKDAGYFSQRVTGKFGSTTAEALRAFNDAFGLSNEPSDRLSEKSAATLTAAVQRIAARPPVQKAVDKTASAQAIRSAQRTLRFLGFYSGRTNGTYDDNLFDAILRFQQKKGLVGSAENAGAGRIGPLTRGKLTESWDRRIVAAMARRLLALHRVETVLDERGKNVARFLETGDNGDQVALLQRLLSDRGFFPSEKINGNYGALTQSAVLKYQMARKLITSESDAGAGQVGPLTLRALRSEERKELYLLVRSEGWRAL